MIKNDDDKPLSEEAMPVSSASIEEVPQTPPLFGGATSEYPNPDVDVQAGPETLERIDDAPSQEEQPAAPTKAIEEWAKELGTADWLFAAAKMHARWPKGREVTESEFQAALDGAANVESH